MSVWRHRCSTEQRTEHRFGSTRTWRCRHRDHGNWSRQALPGYWRHGLRGAGIGNRRRVDEIDRDSAGVRIRVGAVRDRQGKGQGYGATGRLRRGERRSGRRAASRGSLRAAGLAPAVCNRRIFRVIRGGTVEGHRRVGIDCFVRTRIGHRRIIGRGRTFTRPTTAVTSRCTAVASKGIMAYTFPQSPIVKTSQTISRTIRFENAFCDGFL